MATTTSVFDIFNNICRLCGVPQSDFIDVFSEEGRRKRLHFKILTKVDIDVSLTDPLPKIVCRVCCERVELFTRFHENCRVIQNKLMTAHLAAVEDSNTGEETGTRCYLVDNQILINVVTNSNIDMIQATKRTQSETINSSFPYEIRNSFDTVEDTRVSNRSILKNKSNLPDLSNKSEPYPSGCLIITRIEETIEESKEVTQSKIAIPRLNKINVSKPPTLISKLASPLATTPHQVKPPSKTCNSIECDKLQPSFLTDKAKETKGKNTSNPQTIKRLASPKKAKHNLVRLPISENVQKNIEKVSSRKYRCRICDESFLYNHLCVYHVRKHLNDKPFSCSNCGKTFLSMGQLRKHAESHTTSRHICMTCGRKFRNTNHLREHEAIHTDQPAPFPCNICNKSFYFHQSYIGHMESHDVQRSYLCQYCSKSYKSKKHMKEHTARIHQGLLRFTCPTCNKSFYRKSTYQNHLRLHTTERPFNCEVCGHSFNEQTNLKRHMKTHDKNKLTSYIRLEDTMSPEDTMDSAIDIHIDEVEVEDFVQ